MNYKLERGGEIFETDSAQRRDRLLSQGFTLVTPEKSAKAKAKAKPPISHTSSPKKPG